MGMQYDVKQAHLDQSGFMVKYRTRLKGVSFTGAASAGYVVLFDTLSAPVTASVTYARTGDVVTVTKTAHGLNTGDTIGIHFVSGTGGAATDGTYTITKTGADTFTLTDINSGSITGSPAAVYAVGGWLVTYQTLAGDVYTNVPFIPSEGILARNGIYCYMTNAEAAYIFYG